jgi:hypothetical protein
MAQNTFIFEYYYIKIFKKLLKKFRFIRKKSKIFKIKQWLNLGINMHYKAKAKNSRMGTGSGLFVRSAYFLKPGKVVYETTYLLNYKIPVFLFYKFKCVFKLLKVNLLFTTVDTNTVILKFFYIFYHRNMSAVYFSKKKHIITIVKAPKNFKLGKIKLSFFKYRFSSTIRTVIKNEKNIKNPLFISSNSFLHTIGASKVNSNVKSIKITTVYKLF